MSRSRAITTRKVYFVHLLVSLAATAGTGSGCADATLGDGADHERGDGGGEPVGPVGGVPDDVDLRERLAEPTAFTIADAAGGSRARVTAVALGDGQTAAVELSVVGGVVTLSLDSLVSAQFHELLVDTDDVMVSPAVVPPDGLMLTDLTVELAAPASVPLSSSSADEVTGAVELAVDVKWAVEVEHGPVDLAPIRLPELAFDVTVETDPSGSLSARLAASHPGAFWSWAGIFELRDLEIDLVAALDI